MRQRGRHRKQRGDRAVKTLLAAVVVCLFVLEILMLDGDIRGKLSIVDEMEGPKMDWQEK